MDAHNIADTCYRLCMADSTWQSLGFKKRPRHGLFWRISTPLWKKKLEIQVSNELLVVFVAAYLLPLKGDGKLLKEIADFHYGDERAEGLQGSKANFISGVQGYISAEAADWAKIFIARLKISEIPDPNFQAIQSLYAIKFMDDVLTLVAYMKSNSKSWLM